MYIDNIIKPIYDLVEKHLLKKKLATEFEIKGVGRLKSTYLRLKLPTPKRASLFFKGNMFWTS